MNIQISLHRILYEVSLYYGFETEELKSRNKTKQIARARQMYFYLACELSGKSQTAIGALLDRDRFTAHESHLKIQVHKDIYSDTYSEIKDLYELILKPSIVVVDIDLVGISEYYSKSILK